MEEVEEEIELTSQRRVMRSRFGTTIRYNVAVSRRAFAPDLCVAWKGRFSAPKTIVWQKAGESVQDFRKRVEQDFGLE